MGKKYNIFLVARLYLKNYYRFIVTKTKINKSDDAFTLFMYGMKKLYGIDTFEFGDVIKVYGESCIKTLKETEGVPYKKLKNASFEDRVKLVSVSEGYAKAIGLLTAEVIENSRVE